MAGPESEPSFQEFLAQDQAADRSYRFSFVGYLSLDVVRVPCLVPEEVLSSIGYLSLRAEQMIVSREDGAESLWSEVRASALVSALSEPERSEKEQKAAAWLDGWITGLEQNPHVRARGGPVIDILAMRYPLPPEREDQTL